MEQDNAPVLLSLPPANINEELLKAFFRKEIAQSVYQSALQKVSDIHPDINNLSSCYQDLKEAEAAVKKFDNNATQWAMPYYNIHKLIKKVSKEVSDPLMNMIKEKKQEIEGVNNIVIADTIKKTLEQSRVNKIKNSMTLFINSCTMGITSATTDTQIVEIQKRIGSEKSRVSFYEEFIIEFFAKCDALTPIINNRKKQIRSLNEINKTYQKAIDENDVEKLPILRYKKEKLENEMEETTLRLQEEAFNQIANEVPVTAGEPVGEVLSGNNRWRWEVLDIQKLYKKHPELVELVPNKTTIGEYIAAHKSEWKESQNIDITISDAIKFFIKKYL